MFIAIYVHAKSAVISNSLWHHWLQPTRLLCQWNFPRNTGVGCHLLLQGIFLIPESNPHLLQVFCIGRQILYHWATWKTPSLQQYSQLLRHERNLNVCGRKNEHRKVWQIHTIEHYSVLKKGRTPSICDNMDKPWRPKYNKYNYKSVSHKKVKYCYGFT